MKENDAIQVVMEYERKNKPIDVRKNKQHQGYDIISGNKKIEVKGIRKRDGFFLLNNYNFESYAKEPDFHLYLVLGDNPSDADIIVYNRIELIKKIKEARVRFTLEIPLRKEDKKKAIKFDIS